jgi:inorganic pyrophosphatase
MIVEIPKNSTNKYEYDPKRGTFRLDRALHGPLHYPGDYGFIPGTLGEDGDPLDILTLVDEPTYPGMLIEARPVGILEMSDEGNRDAKIFAVTDRNPRFDQIQDIRQVSRYTLREIEYFFSLYKELEGKRITIGGWRGLTRAHAEIETARKRYGRGS